MPPLLPRRLWVLGSSAVGASAAANRPRYTCPFPECGFAVTTAQPLFVHMENTHSLSTGRPSDEWLVAFQQWVCGPCGTLTPLGKCCRKCQDLGPGIPRKRARTGELPPSATALLIPPDTPPPPPPPPAPSTGTLIVVSTLVTPALRGSSPTQPGQEVPPGQ